MESGIQQRSSGPSTGMLFSIAVFTALLVSLGVGFAIILVKGPVLGRAASDTGVVGVTVSGDFGIEVDPGYAAVNFGTMARGASANTLLSPTGSGTLPFLIRNMGNVMADVETCAGQLWSGSSHNMTDYQYSVNDKDPRVTIDDCGVKPCFNKAGSPTSAVPMPTTCPVGTLAVNDLNFEDDHDEAIVHIYIHVPMDEPAGSKASVVTFSAVSSTTYR